MSQHPIASPLSSGLACPNCTRGTLIRQSAGTSMGHNLSVCDECAFEVDQIWDPVDNTSPSGVIREATGRSVIP